MIYAKHLKKIFDNSIVAVDDFSLSVESGTITCLVGSSGCGKTTSLKMINRIVEPSSGSIQIKNQFSHEVEEVAWRRRIGYVKQKAGLFPHLNVFDNISILSQVLKRDCYYIKSKVEELLEMVGLDPKIYKDRYPVELSGGEQQRVGIARALIEDPFVLLMDEPFGALDAMTRSSIHKEFLYLNKKLKKTILLVTHDLNEAFYLGDQVAFMHEGRILQVGTEKDFTKQPVNDFVRDFFNEKH